MGAAFSIGDRVRNVYTGRVGRIVRIESPEPVTYVVLRDDGRYMHLFARELEAVQS